MDTTDVPSWMDPTNDGSNNNNNDLTESLLSGSHTTEPTTTAAAPASASNTNPFAVEDEEQQQQVIFDGELNNNNNNNNNNTTVTVVQTGEKQPNHFRDAWAALLFLAHHVAIFYLAIVWGIPSLNYSYSSSFDDGSSSNNNTDISSRNLQEQQQDNNNNTHYNDDDDSTTTSSIGGGLFFLTLTATLGAIVISALSMRLMISFAEFLIQFCLLFTVACNALFVAFMIVHGPYWTAASFGLICLLLSMCYTRIVWKRVPFAAANLKTAITAVRLNGGIMLVSLGWTIAMTAWSVVWMLALLGVYMRPVLTGKCSDAADDDCIEENSSTASGLIFFALLLSYYWTSETTKNIVHVTTAGVVGTWWFVPDDAGRFCSPAIADSMHRATTWSLGSICFGSLLTAVVQSLHRLARNARRNSRNNAFVLCVVDCLLNFLERLVQYFNSYAFVYVGLYGYDYLSAGKKVFELFSERGWTNIINDQLVRRALLLVSFVMGAMTGCVGILLATIKPDWLAGFGSLDDDDDGSSTTIMTIAFIIPFLMGTATAVVLTSVVSSAVDTVIVAFAEAPLEFERNHPGLYSHMITCWRQVYPNEFGM